MLEIFLLKNPEANARSAELAAQIRISWTLHPSQQPANSTELEHTALQTNQRDIHEEMKRRASTSFDIFDISFSFQPLHTAGITEE